MCLLVLRPILPPYRNQSVDLPCKTIDWFLYDTNICLNGLKVSSLDDRIFLSSSIIKIELLR